MIANRNHELFCAHNELGIIENYVFLRMRRMIAQRDHVIAACRVAVKEALDADDLNQG